MAAMFKQAAVRIRPYVADDASTLYAAVSASLSTLSQWLPWATPDYDLARAEAWIAHCIAAREADREYHFGIFETASGKLIGGVGLNHRIPAYRSANMGYWVADEVRGRGIAVEATRQAARFGFETLALQRIAILIQPQNRASTRVAMKLGAVCEGIARNAIVVADQPHDAMVFSLTPDDLSLIVRTN
jgi:RimJ/RimL family protein N-acetyltransferase